MDIVQFEPRFSGTVGRLIYETDRQLFELFFKNPEGALEKLLRNGVCWHPERIIMAASEGEVLGVLAYDLEGSESGVIDLFRKLGPIDALRVMMMDLIDSLSTRKVEDGDLYIASLAVAPEARGQGVGFRLLQEAQMIAEERGLDRLTLDVSPTNTPALNL
ncbi:GNAT family N-acetyltransferase [Methanothermobacter sp.]|uniref:GNAT family N-acetyltransferase n=1 Tax=Methanothermobacter sp. TaxID=1884223 RepID=UPI002619C910|nr:GNAT family N-acetyltransferase [Methanothermobacter sp.]MDI9614798.1 GNAT family N-acetyltransferase [Methanothermobacter sp.]